MEDNYGRKELINDLKSVLGKNYQEIPQTIKNQINRFIINNGLTFKDIGRCLWYGITIDHRKVEMPYGVYWIPDYLQQSRAYFAALKLKEKQNAEILKESAPEIVKIDYPKLPERKVDLIDIDELLKGDKNGK